MLVRSLALLILLTLGACASLPGPGPGPGPGAEEGIEFAPWRLPENKPREVVQMLNGSYGAQDFTLQVRLSLTPERMQVAALDLLGRRVFDITWDARGVAASRAEWVSADMNAVDILKVIVATYWPADDPMQARVADRTASLIITYQTTREHAWNEQVAIRDPKWNYEMTIISYELAL